MADGTGTTAYVYDAVNRLTSVTFPGSRVVGYEYDEVGDRTSITYPSSDEAIYAYDEAHNLISVTDWNTDETTYAYDVASLLETVNLANGVVGSYTYDNADRLTGIEWVYDTTTLAEVDYTLDDVGNRTQRVDSLGTHTYDYDDLYRLTDVTYPGPEDVDYTYDAVGNRLTLVTGAGSAQYAHDAADRLTSVTPPGESAVSYTWDDNGNLTARGADSFEWDAADRLVSATADSATTTFVYNGDGLRDSLTFNSNTTTFTWDVNRSIPQVLDDETFQYLYGVGRIAQVGASETHYYLTDGLGSTLALTDEAGDVVNTYDYDVFGALRTESGSQANDFTFAGEQVDGSTGLQYLRARYYDVDAGRFVSRDPVPGVIGVPASQTRYPYVSNSPTNLLDPSGLCIFGAPCIDDIAKGAAQVGEDIAYGVYVGSYEALDELGRLPDEIEVVFLPLELGLTVSQAHALATAAALDYLATGNFTNVYNYPDKEGGTRILSDWWPDPIDPSPGCDFPCTELPGISPNADSPIRVRIDFQWPLGE